VHPSPASSAALIPTDSSITNVAQSQESQAEFTSRVARTRHDLRNCIGQILGFSEMLIEEVQGGGREPLRADLDLIHNRASQMIARIEEGLDRSKIEAGVRDSLALQQTRENAVEVADATKRLLEKARDLRDDVFIDDLSRIGAAADKTLELVSLTYDLLSDAVETIPAAETVLESSAAVIARSWKVPENLQALRRGAILVVDDLAENRELLMRRLSPLGYSITVSENGEQALESVRGCPVDLILLDIFMPGLDGIEVLQRLKANPATQHIPVIMLSSSDKLDNIVHCITLGADDFLPKPFNTTLLMARIESSLSKKRLRDQESAFLARLKAEQEISERLLLNILPRPIAERLKLGEKNIADNFAEATVLFTDFVGFTELSSTIGPKELVRRLNEIFSAFDQLCGEYGLEKIKMIGDAYMVVGGLPTPRADHAEAAAGLALEMQKKAACFEARDGQPFRMRIGINTGPVVAGVIGTKKFAYDLWGDTVNLASRMESHAPTGGILVTESTHKQLRRKFKFSPGRLMRIKGKGELLTYLLLGRKEEARTTGVRRKGKHSRKGTR